MSFNSKICLFGINMEKRYQVFVSSTYEDLRVERQEVMQALLELDCIPSGMELFPAADEDQWSLIKRVIDECDYYIVICAGRYGSISSSGISYTEMEYRYALEQEKPTLAFLHENPHKLVSGMCEQTDDGKERLKQFRNLLGQKLCKFWDCPADLGSVVSRSLIRLIKQRPAVGWVRANELAEGAAAAELLRLRRQIEELQENLKAVRNSAPPGTEDLSQGYEEYNVKYYFETIDASRTRWSWELSIDLSWNEILYDVGPVLVDEASDAVLRNAMNGMVRSRSRIQRSEDLQLKEHSDFRNFQIDDHDFQTIKIQLRALGLVTKSERPRSVKDSGSYWMLTPYGDQVLTNLRAIRRDDNNELEGSDESEDPSTDT